MSRDVPHSSEAEDSIIGAVLLSPGVLPQVAATLDPSDFFQPRAQTTWVQMLHMHDHGMPVDIVTVSEALKAGEMVDTEWLLGCQNATPSISSVKRYAGIVIEAARRRRLIAHASDVIAEAYEVGNDFEEVLGRVADFDPLLLPRNPDLTRLHEDIGLWNAEAEVQEEEEPWLVSHILRPKWRVILVAGEGVGKMVYLRQIGLHAAAGLDPHDPRIMFPPVKVLCIDAENPRGAIVEQHAITNRQIKLVDRAGDMYQMWHVEGGVDLRKRGPRAELEAILQRVRPQLVIAGPLYKLFRRASNEDMEQSTIEFLEIIDDLRTRYGVAIMIEHHAPKAAGGAYREMGPFGSSALLRWPEFGLAINDHGEAKTKINEKLTCELEHWRVPRVKAEWPSQLTRLDPNSQLGWAPTYLFRRGGRVGAQLVDGEWAYTTPS